MKSKFAIKQFVNRYAGFFEVDNLDCTWCQHSHGGLCSNVPVPTAVQSLSDDLLKYYQLMTRAILGDDPHLMKVCSPALVQPCLCLSVPGSFLPSFLSSFCLAVRLSVRPSRSSKAWYSFSMMVILNNCI